MTTTLHEMTHKTFMSNVGTLVWSAHCSCGWSGPAYNMPIKAAHEAGATDIANHLSTPD